MATRYNNKLQSCVQAANLRLARVWLYEAGPIGSPNPTQFSLIPLRPGRSAQLIAVRDGLATSVLFHLDDTWTFIVVVFCRSHPTKVKLILYIFPTLSMTWISKFSIYLVFSFLWLKPVNIFPLESNHHNFSITISLSISRATYLKLNFFQITKPCIKDSKFVHFLYYITLKSSIVVIIKQLLSEQS